MVNIVNAVTTSLLSARAQSRAADTAVGVFESAKARGDQATMERALSYAGPAVSGALKYSDAIRDDLRKAVAAAREEARKEAEEAAAQKNQDTTADEPGTSEQEDSTTGTSGSTAVDNGVPPEDTPAMGYTSVGTPATPEPTVPEVDLQV